ncbi:MAG: YceI family protein, partial [Halioglobus sp.]|nr:YceI family protein [Halioglobus sp.]
LYTATGWAQWDLDSERSTINFISIKNNAVAETHSFSSMVGFIGADGNLQLAIDLDSVDTLIEIRNERMRELLFETAKFPAAKISAQIDPAIVAGLVEAGTIVAEFPVTLSLHDVKRKLIAPVTIISDNTGRLRVFTTRPLVVNVADFGLVGGVEALREIAGLDAIAGAVPVTLSLTFTRSQ